MPFLFRGASWRLARPITHPAEIGALSILYAAIDPAARGGEYYGPGGRFEWRGHPTRLESTPRSHDPAVQQRLWEVSEQLTDVRYDALAIP